MKSRHAVALALVGWYLMIPPYPTPSYWQQIRGLEGCPDRNTPLSQWTIQGVFDTAEQCKNELTTYKRWTALRTRDKKNSDNRCDGFTPELLASSDAQCIASDDPRLKGK